jgi:hypothetical protein
VTRRSLSGVSRSDGVRAVRRCLARPRCTS